MTSGHSLSLSINLLLHPYGLKGSHPALRPGSAKEEANICNMEGLRNLRAPIRVINLENLMQGTVQPDASQQISLTVPPSPLI